MNRCITQINNQSVNKSIKIKPESRYVCKY